MTEPMDAPRRVILHPGFHKTGTTTVQTFLRENGKHIYPRWAMMLPGKLRKTLCASTIYYARSPSPRALDILRQDLSDLLSQITLGKRNLLITDENLSGLMPGRDQNFDYQHLPDILTALTESLRNTLGRDCQITIYLGTRDPENWLRSTYRHNLRLARLVDDFDSYAARFTGDVQADTITAIQQALPDVTVETGLLDDLSQTPFGPAQPLVDLLDLPPHLARKLQPVAPENHGVSAALADQFLALNRSDATSTEIADQKAALLARARNSV